MENFDLKGWMKSNNQGPYSMFEQFEGKKKKLNEGIGGYVDMKPVNELQKPEKIYQDDEEDENSFVNRDRRMMDLGGEQITNALHNLMDSGYGPRDIKEFVYMALYEDIEPEDISGINADQEALIKGINDLLYDGFDPDDIEEFCDSVLENKDAMEKNYGSLEEDEIKDHNKLMKLGGNMMYKSIIKLIENGVSTETIIKMVPKLIKQYKSF